MDAELITQGTLQTRAGRALPLQRTEVRATVTGPVAEVEVRQVFRNDTDTAIEAVYLFPLPHDASVHRMLFRIEDRVVQGVVKDKAEARRTYEKARAEGRAATLLEEEKPSLFTLSVANVAPGATIEVELGYQELVAYDDGRWRFVFPLVAPERYRDPPPAAAGALAPPRMPTGARETSRWRCIVRGDGMSSRCVRPRTR
jgi:Ca-activated chloride channel family protein